MGADLVAIIEACYATDLDDDQRWLSGIIDSAQPGLASHRGIVSYLYESAEGGRVQPLQIVMRGIVGDVTEPFLRDVIAQVPGELVQQLTQPVMSGRSVAFPNQEQVWAHLKHQGIEDILVVHGRDPSGRGCYLGAALSGQADVSVRSTRLWSRLAAHMAAGYRLRRRLRPSGGAETEAILSRDGRVEHAESPAQSPAALQALREAALAIGKARGPLRNSDPEAAVAEWRGLIAARWSLIERFENDGKSYLLARRNDPPIADVSSLSPRELQAVAYASLGHTNKLIAYEMGIAPSTVGVLLYRAAARLSARSRNELIAAYLRTKGS
jgi:DNA-binding CsgD family transcriptional regulator